MHRITKFCILLSFSKVIGGINHRMYFRINVDMNFKLRNNDINEDNISYTVKISTS